MGFTAQSGSVGFRTQLTKGTYRSPGSGGVFMKTRSGALAGTRDLIIPDPEIGGGRDVVDAYLGPIAFKGDYAFYPRMDSLATLLYGALGVNTNHANTPEAGANQHVMTPVDIANLPWLSVEENIGNDFDHFRYTDAKVNTLHLEADAAGIMMGTCGLVALSQVAVPSASATASPAWDDGPAIVGSNTFLSLSGTPLPAKSWSFDINNQLEDNDFRIGSLFLGDTTEKRRLVTAGAKVRPSSAAFYREAVFGGATDTQAGGLVTHESVILTCQTYEFIGSTATLYSVELDFGAAVIKPFQLNPNGDDVIEFDIEIQMVRPVAANPIVTATVTNSLAAVA